MSEADIQNLAWRTRVVAADQDYTTDVSEGMVVLDAVHQIQATDANDHGGALELQSREVWFLLG